MAILQDKDDNTVLDNTSLKTKSVVIFCEKRSRTETFLFNLILYIYYFLHLTTACVRGALYAANLAAVLRAAPGMDAAIAADAVASLACVKRDAIESVLELVQAGLTCKAKANAWIRQIQALEKPDSLPPPSIQQTQWLAKQGAAAL